MATPRTLPVLLFVTALLLPVVGQAQDLPTVAVMALRPTGGISADEAALLTDRLLVEMARTGRFQVTERSRVDEILKEQAFQLSGACDEATCLAQVGKLVGVGLMVGGSVGKIGDTYSVNVRMVGVETGTIQGTASKDYQGSSSYLVTTAMKEIAEELAWPARPTRSTPRPGRFYVAGGYAKLTQGSNIPNGGSFGVLGGMAVPLPAGFRGGIEAGFLRLGSQQYIAGGPGSTSQSVSYSMLLGTAQIYYRAPFHGSFIPWLTIGGGPYNYSVGSDAAGTSNADAGVKMGVNAGAGFDVGDPAARVKIGLDVRLHVHGVGADATKALTMMARLAF